MNLNAINFHLLLYICTGYLVILFDSSGIAFLVDHLTFYSLKSEFNMDYELRICSRKPVNLIKIFRGTELLATGSLK